MRPRYSENIKTERRPSSLPFVARFFIGVLTILVLFFCVTSFFSQKNDFDRLARENERLSRERDRLYQKYESLQGLDEIAGSREYVERLARDYLGMALPGEVIFVVD